MCRRTTMNASWDLPAVSLTGSSPLSSRRRQRYQKISIGAFSSSSSSSTEEEAEGRRAASESCLLSLANFTESLSYRPGTPPASPPSPPLHPLSDRKRSKHDSPLSLRRRKNRKLFAFEEEFSFRRSASADASDGGGRGDASDDASVPRSRSLDEEGRQDEDDALGPLSANAVRRTDRRRELPPRQSPLSSLSPSSSLLLHPRTQIDVGRTYDTDHLMMAEGVMTTIPFTPTKGMVGQRPCFLSLGQDKAAAAISNGGFWVLQS